MPVLTDIVVRNAKVPAPGLDGKVTQIDLWDEGLPGFGLRVSSTGKKSWIVGVRILREGRRVFTRIVLGVYPGLSLAEAREKARDAKVAASQNQDPREVREREKQTRLAQSRNTFSALVEDFLMKYVERKGLRPTTQRDYRQILQGDDVAAWSKRPVPAITKADVVAILDRIVARGAPTQANHFLAYTRKFFGWCVERGVIETAPTDRLSPPAKSSARDRALSMEEVREVWAAIETLEASEEPQVRGDIFGAIFKLLLLTGQRREEVAGMRWEELRSLDAPEALWEIPGERTKNHRPHLVPLAPQAIAILKGLISAHDRMQRCGRFAHALSQ